MDKRIAYAGVAVLALHSLVHLLGAVVYLELVALEGFAYKTTLLGGAVDVGATGIRLFGFLWAVTGVAFLVAAKAVLSGWQHWRPALVAVALVSLVLTTADFSVAYGGVLMNVAIVTAVVYEKRVLSENTIPEYGQVG